MEFQNSKKKQVPTYISVKPVKQNERKYNYLWYYADR